MEMMEVLAARDESAGRLQAAREKVGDLENTRRGWEIELAMTEEGSDSEAEIRRRIFEVDGQLDRAKGEVTIATRKHEQRGRELAEAERESREEASREEASEQERARTNFERWEAARSACWEVLSPRTTATAFENLLEEDHQSDSWEMAKLSALSATPDLTEDETNVIVVEAMRMAYGGALRTEYGGGSPNVPHQAFGIDADTGLPDPTPLT